MIRHFLIHLILVCTLANPAYFCSAGCLRCETSTTEEATTNKCSICDWTNGYTLTEDQNKCEKDKIIDCEYTSPTATDQVCLVCKPGMLFDNVLKKCIEVPEEKRKANCLRYQGKELICDICEKGYNMMGGDCHLVNDETVPNCHRFKSETQCSICSDGFFQRRGACLKLPTIENCLIWSQYACETCLEGYLSVAQVAFDISTHLPFIMELAEQSNSLKIFQALGIDQTCQKIELEECLKPASATACEICKDGFLLNSSQICVLKPLPSISDCAIYHSLKVCKKCSKGYYLSNNECIKTTDTEFCEDYHINMDQCVECQQMYYIVSGQCVLRNLSKNFIENCKKLKLDEDKCETCKESFQMTPDSTRCLPSIFNCKSYTAVDISSTINKCGECELGYYTIEDKATCLLQNVANCGIHLEQQNKCKMCKEGFYLSDGLCSDQDLANCVKYILNYNKCSQCVSLYYLNSDTGCTQIPGEHKCKSSDGLNMDCVTCLEGLVLNATSMHCESATSITSTRSASDSRDNLTTSTHKNANDILSKLLEPESKKPETTPFSLTTGTSSLSCSDTLKVYLLRTLELISADQVKNQNCQKYEPDLGRCRQCIPGYQFNDLEQCERLENHSFLCSQIKADDTVTKLSENKNCALCANPLRFTLVDGTCQINDHIVENCLKYSSDFKKCEICNSTFILRSDYEEFTYKTESDIPSTTTTSTFGDLMTSESDPQIKICKSDYYFDSSIKVCLSISDASGLSLYLFDRDVYYRPIKNVFFSDSNNCLQEFRLFDQSSYDTELGACIKCKTELLPVISNLQNTFVNFNSDSKIGVGEAFSAFTYCATPGYMFSFTNLNHTDTSIDSSKCGLGMRYEYYGGVACIRCPVGQMGKVINMTNLITFGTLTSPVPVLMECQPHSDIESLNIQGLDFHRNGLRSKTKYSDFISASSCKSDKFLVYFFTIDEWADLQPVELRIYTDSTSNNYQLPLQSQCYSDVSKVPSSFKDNCQIFAYHRATSDSRMSQTEFDDLVATHCLACKPGFKAVVDDDSQIITQCVEIEGCQFSHGENIYMNMCVRCVNGMLAMKHGRFDFTQCVDTTTSASQTQPLSDNCYVADITETDAIFCRLCKEGYDLGYKNKCIKNLNTSCSNFTFGKMNLRGLKRDMNSILTNSFLALEHKSKFTGFNSFCYDTVGNSGQVIKFKKHEPGCYPISDTLPYPFSYDCKKVNSPYNRFDNCQSCIHGYTLFSPRYNVSHCVSSKGYSFENMNEVFSINNSLSLKCDPGFILLGGKCVKDNCKLKNNELCALCEEGYIAVNSKIYCTPNPDPFSNCLYFSPLLGHCVRCRDSEHANVFYLLNANNKSEYLTTVCKQNQLMNTNVNSSQNSSEFYFAKHVILSSSAGSAFENSVLSFDFLQHDDNIDRVRYVRPPESGTGGAALDPCVYYQFNEDSPALANCKRTKYDFCLECNDGYGLTTGSTCVSKSGNDKCVLFKSEGNCLRCEEGHYNKNSTCQPYAVPNCVKYDLNTYACIMCEKDHFFNDVNGCVKDTSSITCRARNMTSTECQTCNEDSYLLVIDSSCESDPKNCNTCVKRNPSKYNCMIYDQFSNECLGCYVKEQYLQVSNGECKVNDNNCNVCKSRTWIENCEEFNMYKDECLACASGYYLQTTSPIRCVFYESSDCKERHFGVDACSDCLSSQSSTATVASPTQSDYFCPPKSPLNCKNYKSNKTKCKTCKTGYVLDQTESTCLVSYYQTCQTIAHDYKSCLTCKKNQYNSQNSGCVNYSDLKCEIFWPDYDKCYTCDSKRFYNSERGCQQYDNIENCIRYSESKDFCEECASGYHLDFKERVCVTRALTGCSGENVVFNKDECRFCDEYETKFKGPSEPLCNSQKANSTQCLHFDHENKCQMCKQADQFYNYSTNICQIRSNFEGCTDYDISRDICKDCLSDSSYFINPESGICQYRSNQTNCKAFDSIYSTKCIQCEDYLTYYLDTTQGKCIERNTFAYCQNYENQADACKKCVHMFYWSNNMCKPRYYTYCEIFDDYRDDCIKCNLHQFYFFDVNNSRVCKFRYNYGLCKEYHFTDSLCTACNEQSHYLKDGVCHKFEKMGCSGDNFAQNNGICLKCDDQSKFFYNPDTKDCIFRTRTDCLEFDPNSDNCESCNSTFYYLQQYQSICDHNTVGCKTCSFNFNSNCEVLNPFNNGCSECKTGMYLEMEGKQCHEDYFQSCYINEKVQTDCFDCLFTSTKINPFSVQCSHRPMNCNHCFSYKAENCVVRDYNADRCLICPTGHWLNEDTGSCQMGTSNTNCKTSDQNNVKHCTSCNEPFFKLVIDPECSQHSSNCFNICVEQPSVKQRVPQCQGNTEDNLDCANCYDGYFLTFTSGHCYSDPSSCNTCSEYTVTGCMTYDQAGDQCASCQSPYFKLGMATGCNSAINHCKRCIRKSTVGQLVPNCVNNSDESLDCLHCNSTAYLTKTEGNCYDEPQNCNTCTNYSISNCLQYNLYKDECTACDENLFNLKNDPTCSTSTQQCLRCVTKRNIEEMVPACSRDNSNKLDCDACIFGYYMTLTPNNCYSEPSSCNLCKPYSATNCKSYDSYKNQCLTCYPGLHFLKLNQPCPDADTSDCKACLTYDAVNCQTFNQFKDECDSCTEKHYKDLNTKICKAYTTQHCISYYEFGDSCLACENQFFLKESQCEASTPVEKCEIYDTLADKCVECNEGYFVEFDENECLENPSGPINCIRFNENKICDLCTSNYYLTADSMCKRVENEVDNCDLYAGEGVCSQCRTSYILIGQKCEQAEVQNCLEYIDKTRCKTCEPNYILDQSQNSTCSPSGITNCESAKQSKSIICEKCKEKYIPSKDETECLLLDEKTKIKNCQVHAKERFCTSCEPGYYLVEGNFACREFEAATTSEPKCVSVKESDVPFCTFCQIGFYLDASSKCQKCSIVNCGICSADQCEMCLFGSYMNPERACVRTMKEEIRSVSINRNSVFWLLALLVLGFFGNR